MCADLNKSIVSEPRTGQSGRGPQESRVCDLFDSFPDREDKGSISERNNNERIILIWIKGREVKGLKVKL